MIVDEYIDRHIELVEVGQEHNDEYDSFIDDDSNWIKDEEGLNQPKTGDLANKYEFLAKVYEDQALAVHASHELISKCASDWEDTGSNNALIDHKFTAFFNEFGV